MAKTESYIPDHHVIPAPKAEYLNRLFDSIVVTDQPTRRLGAHIFKSYQYQYRHMDGVPVPYETYDDALPGANPFLLKRVIEIGSYGSGSCRTFLPREPYWSEYMNAAACLTFAELNAAGSIDYDTGRKANKRPRSRTNDENNKPQPQVTRDAIQTLTANGIYFDSSAIESYYQAFKSQITDRDRKEKTEPYRSFKNADACRDGMARYHITNTGDGIAHLKQPAWFAAPNGRLYIVGACLQSANGDMKGAGYGNVPGFNNFDIVSCHVFIAIALMQQARLNAQPLIEFYNSGKGGYANDIGVSDKCVKLIVLSMLNGADLPKKSIKQYIKGKYSIVDYLAKEKATDTETLNETLKLCWAVLGPIHECIKKWHSYLLNEYIDSHKTKGGKGFVLPNELGKFLRLWELDLKSRQRWHNVGKVASHLLVGFEQACTQEQIATDKDCTFCSSEHDGFTTMNSTPDMNLWQQITERHGMGGMQLVPKLI